jgi:tRNA(Ile2) C34 agmatinyltransferase TiaS
MECFGLVVAVILVAAASEGWRRWQKYQRWLRMKDAMGLTCHRCHHLAEPVSGGRNRYRCPNCGRQFAGARHGL